jgi:predicted permease
MRRFLRRVANLFRRGRAESEMLREIGAHLDLMREEFERRGMAPPEAALAARRAFGGVDQARELHRESRSFAGLEQFFKDVRYAARNLRRNPGFTIGAAAALALGIGANASIFAIYDNVALKPLPVTDAARVVRLKRWFERTHGDKQYDFAYAEFQYLREHSSAFSDVIASDDELTVLAAVGGRATQEHLDGRAVSGNYFSGLGVKPHLGRLLRPDDDGAAGANPVVVLSYNYWQRKFQSDSNVVGQVIKLAGMPYNIIGVAPRNFAGTDLFATAYSFWAPLSMLPQLEPAATEAQSPGAARGPVVQVLARLKPGISRAQAQAETSLLLQRYLAGTRQAERTTAVTLQGTSYFDGIDDLGGFTALAGAVWTAMSLVLLVACANVGNMLLARGAARQREIGVRLALGAGRGRVVRQLLAESTLLALLGGAAGVLLAAWGGRWLWVSMVSIFRGFGVDAVDIDFSPDAQLVAYTLAVSVAVGILFGLAPALRFTRLDLTAVMKEEVSVFGARLRRSRLRGLLLGAQVAVAALLVTVCGSEMSALVNSRPADPGFETRRTYILMSDGDNKKDRAVLRDKLAALPVVAGVAIGDVPLMGNSFSAPMRMGNRQRTAIASVESDGYFETIGIRLVRGREFTRPEADHGAAVAVISESTASAFWQRGNPIGQHFALDVEGKRQFSDFEVVGVAKDIRFAGISETDPLHVYLPTGGAKDYRGGLFFRIRGDRDKALSAVQSAVEAVNRSLLQSVDLVSLEDGPVAMQRGATRVMSTLAGTVTLLSLVLAAVGVYGVMTFLVALRTKEIGIRMALGATARTVLRGILIQGLRPVFIGLGVGFVAATALSLWPNGQHTAREALREFFGDWTLYGELALVLAVAAAASLMAARRSLRGDPMTALRHE